MSAYTSLVDLDEEALAHRDEINEVKRQIGINHGYFDAWIYGFLENKKFNIEETVAKLHRRFAMEVNDLATYKMTDYMHGYLRKGIVQVIGEDKKGRVALYLCGRRDFPDKQFREERRHMFDMYVCYCTRLRRTNMDTQMVMIIDQHDASMSKNMDISFQSDMALRISKFYPGGVDKMYMCSMGLILTVAMKPILKALPSIVSSRLVTFSAQDIERGALLELFDADVLPVSMGGKNDCDNQAHWNASAELIEKYFLDMQHALNERGLTVKEFELEQLGIGAVTVNDPATISKGGSPGLQQVSFTLPDTGPSMMALQRTVTHLAFGTGSPHEWPSRATSCFEMRTMMTEPWEYEDDRGALDADEFDGSCPFGDTPGWERVVEVLPKKAALALLDEILRTRQETEKQELSERYKLASALLAEQRVIGSLQGKHKKSNFKRRLCSGISCCGKDSTSTIDPTQQ